MREHATHARRAWDGTSDVTPIASAYSYRDVEHTFRERGPGSTTCRRLSVVDEELWRERDAKELHWKQREKFAREGKTRTP